MALSLKNKLRRSYPMGNNIDTLPSHFVLPIKLVAIRCPILDCWKLSNACTPIIAHVIS
jgi:hypothetical protein